MSTDAGALDGPRADERDADPRAAWARGDCLRINDDAPNPMTGAPDSLAGCFGRVYLTDGHAGELVVWVLDPAGAVCLAGFPPEHLTRVSRVEARTRQRSLSL